ncbi:MULTISPECIES: maleylacetate reductase [unclassified Bosea (in: a-proteobacteria)]|uniref:maleylacetate reductase n=1 Tax=unclassified Bosea (in: a-proteobacteria) TaxID=2653178 RepID=UPI000F759C1F|nr:MULTISPECIES: maleylacetate reductase [unclassified Bosea (in: a-proteobacteria)]AZO78281.1 maleylacetate reductase [Bosea sp. Tri-49]RXT20232.1 maleylacetate reductase [Bosea sp. Tri-39]RXT37104.1 maleylacetate reductase [Bosea sp. Tri-54]
MRTFHAGFEADHPPVRVRLGAGIRHELGAEMTALGLSHALVLTTPDQAAQGERLLAALGRLAHGQFSKAAMHTPIEITKAALEAARGADCLVAIGGGSTIGLAKAIALNTDLPQIVLPTTYAGSEATPVLGQTANGVKETLRSPKVQPEVILYDPELVATLPTGLSVTSGLNAMAHAVEALYARDRNPLSDQLALGGLRAFKEGLPRVVADPGDLPAREATQFGAWLCGTVLAQVGMALQHKLCHTLGGSFALPHAETHAILLPHSAAYNADAAAGALAPVAELFGGSVGGGLYDFSVALGAPVALRDLGLVEGDLDRAADLAGNNPYWNPRPIERDAIRVLLQHAWEGARPQ